MLGPHGEILEDVAPAKLPNHCDRIDIEGIWLYSLR